MQSICRGGSWWEWVHGPAVYTAVFTAHLKARGIEAYVSMDGMWMA